MKTTNRESIENSWNSYFKQIEAQDSVFEMLYLIPFHSFIHSISFIAVKHETARYDELHLC